MFHTTLDPNTLAGEFRRDDRIRIENILDPDFAEQMTKTVETEIDYATVAGFDGQGKVISPAEIVSMSQQEKKILHQSLMSDASRGSGFLYHGHQLTGTDNAGLKGFLDFLNQPASIDMIRKITGSDEISHADGQATRYVPGHYLTRHLDNPSGETRRYAYVFSFSRQWHPDWGGLLLFYEQDGTPREAWAPAFNTLSLFDVRHIHAVTCVAPYAAAPRYSITGWFRA